MDLHCCTVHVVSVPSLFIYYFQLDTQITLN